MRREARAPAITGVLLTAALLAGCGGGGSAGRGRDDALARYPGTQEQIQAYYRSQGSGEPGSNCGRGAIKRIEGSRVVSDTPVEVVLAVTYRFTGSPIGGSGQGCAGTNTRYFTFDREADGGLTLALMADEQP